MKKLFRVQTGSAPDFRFSMEMYNVSETGDFGPDDDDGVRIKSSSPAFIHDGVVYEIFYTLAVATRGSPLTLEEKTQKSHATLDTIQPTKETLPSPALELWTFNPAFANSFSLLSTFLREMHSRGERAAQQKAQKAFEGFLGAIGISLPSSGVA
jgi:hypothetical protein